MRMIISPAKKMRTDPDGLAAVGLPRFRDKAERVKQFPGAAQRGTAAGNGPGARPDAGRFGL